jgi:hypothetical protein
MNHHQYWKGPNTNELTLFYSLRIFALSFWATPFPFPSAEQQTALKVIVIVP